MAFTAANMINFLPNFTKLTFLFRFISTTKATSDFASIYLSLIRQLKLVFADRLKHNSKTDLKFNPSKELTEAGLDVIRLKKYFIELVEWIGLVASEENIFMFIDGVDQLATEMALNWLILEGLPQNLKVIVSVGTSHEMFNSIRKLVKAKSNYLELKELTASGSLGILNDMLKVI